MRMLCTFTQLSYISLDIHVYKIDKNHQHQKKLLKKYNMSQKCKHTGRRCAALQTIDNIYSKFLVFNFDYMRELIFYVENCHIHV